MSAKEGGPSASGFSNEGMLIGIVSDAAAWGRIGGQPIATARRCLVDREEWHPAICASSNSTAGFGLDLLQADSHSTELLRAWQCDQRAKGLPERAISRILATSYKNRVTPTFTSLAVGPASAGPPLRPTHSQVIYGTRHQGAVPPNSLQMKRGLVKHPGDWPWSSWRFHFWNDASVLGIDKMV